jgi:phosphoenolpyruvate carboxylase
MSISPSIRALYRVIGNIIGKQIFDRISNDDNLASDPVRRKELARKLIDTITKLRRALSSTRDFCEIERILLDINPGEDPESKLIATKLLSWILEAYLLLNQSSTACAEITKPDALLPDRIFASKALSELREQFSSDEDLAKVFAENFSANLVLTAHPTAGIQPDYVNHIKHMVETVQEIALRIDPQEWESVEPIVADLIEDISLSISHMVRAKPYNSTQLHPVDESKNFLNNITEAWNIIPDKIQALEKELKKYLGKQFRLEENAFKLHSWVARDIDGNPTVSQEQHLRSVLQERLHFLTKYRLELEKLWQNLSDDFTSNADLPTKTFFRDDGFKAFYDSLMQEYGDVIDKPNEAYRVVIGYGIIPKLEGITNRLLNLDNIDMDIISAFQGFSVAKDIIEPLELIRTNKHMAPSLTLKR